LHSGYDYPQKFIANRIDKDLILDIEKLKSANTQPERNLQDKKNIAIMPVIFHLSRDQNLANVLQDKMETIFIEKKFTVLERKEINQAINEVKMSQTGLTEEKQNQLGKMLNATNLIISEILRIQETGNTIDFSVKNLDVQTGKILWKYEFQLDDKDLSHTVNESMKSLKENIK
jgi:hypothetical protein